MLENYYPETNRFNVLFCKYRIKNYVNETANILTRHKILFAFIICLLAPGVNNLPKIGLPFFEIINPTATMPLKLLCIGGVLAFSIMLTNAQSNFIKGGKLRNYLNLFDISTNAHKKIDLTILIISLNFIWLAIILGSMFIYTYRYNTSNVLSLFCLYFSFILGYLVLLLSQLYKNKKYALVLLLNLIFIASISSFQIPLINFGGAILSSLYSYFIFEKMVPLETKRNSGKLSISSHNPLSQSIRVFFALQCSSYRQHTKLFITKLFYCFALSAFLIYLTMTQEFSINKIGFFITILGFQIFLLSTLFSLFQKDEIDCTLFHKIFPYQKHLKYFKEVIFIFLLFLCSNTLLLLYLITENRALFIIIFPLILSSFLPFTLNRLLYRLSLRLCLFTSLMSSVFWIVIQYLLIGVLLEY